MTKRITALFLILIFLFQFSAFATELDIINGDFENTVMTFTSVSYYDEVVCSGKASGHLYAPETDEQGQIFHTGEYMYTVSLEEGKLYNFKLNIRGFENSNKSGEIDAKYNSGKARIYFNIKDIGTTWTELVCPFIAGTTGDFDIGLNVYTSEAGALIDNISITESEEKPEKMEIFGHRSVYVPDIGYRSYSYSAVAVDKGGNIVPVVKSEVVFENLPTGVYESDEAGVITITADATPGERFTVKTAKSAENSGLTPREINVTLGDNLIENGEFDDLPLNLGFEAMVGNMEVIDTPRGYEAKMTSPQYKDNAFITSFKAEGTYVLQPEKMYVFRARVYSDGDESLPPVASASVDEESGDIIFSISQTGREAKDVYAVLRVDSEGIYKLKFKFENRDDRTVFVENIGVHIEENKPEEILVKAPAHIAIPEDSISIPVICAAKDQEGNITEGAEGIVVRLDEEKNGVSVSENVLHIDKNVKNGEIKLVAENAEYKISKQFTVTVNSDSIGDGSFEKHEAGEWVSTASPSILETISRDACPMETVGEKAAKLTLNGAVSAVLFDSVNLYKAGQVYVFGGRFEALTESPTMLSILLCEVSDINYSNTIACLQTIIKNGEMRAVFMPNRDITGRIMLGFNTLDNTLTQEIIMDGIYTEKAYVETRDVSVSGYPYAGKVLSGKHKFDANFDATEISTYRWLSSSSRDGMYMPIEKETGESLSVSEKLVGSYVKFEVTPVSLNGPVFGESKTSSPVLISHIPSGGGTKLPEVVYEEDEKEDVYSPEKNTGSGGALNVVDIHAKGDSYENVFFDIQNHWAKEEICILNAYSIVNGMGNMLFAPDEQITRAQFSAFIIRAFSLAPLHYSGTFDDVKDYNWYSGAVETVTKYAIANGVSGTLFAPEEPVTREQMTVMIARSLHLAGINIENTPKNNFSDSDKISSYAGEYVNIATHCGIVTGYPDKTFRPQESATRAEAVVIIKRMIEYVLNNKK